MFIRFPRPDYFGKLFIVTIMCLTSFLAGCSTNPATGKRQFTAFMSPQQEVAVGAQEHQKIAAQFGFYEDKDLQSYVSGIGARVTKDTERPEVTYRFYVLDSPIVNAFAVPGGYIYVSRGLLALANNEAELAAVLGHEAGHITGRHSAERYSRGTLASIGATVASIAIDTPGANDLVGLGTNLYLSAYSRAQETESDTLGLRYMHRGGYDTDAMASFLSSMQAQSALDNKIEGNSQRAAFNYFSTHPATADRVAGTRAQAASYPENGVIGRSTYLRAIDGMTYGDSAKQGFTRGTRFIHPDIGFQFEAPKGFTIKNQPRQVVAGNKQSGAVMVFDMAGVKAPTDPMTYLKQIWMKGDSLKATESITVGGMPAATATFDGTVNGKAARIRLMAMRWDDKRFARFQIAMPKTLPAAQIEALKKASYSFRRLSAQEKSNLRPYRIRVITAKTGDTAESLARKMAVHDHKLERFRVLNSLGPAERVRSGERYKIIAQ